MVRKSRSKGASKGESSKTQVQGAGSGPGSQRPPPEGSSGGESSETQAQGAGSGRGSQRPQPEGSSVGESSETQAQAAGGGRGSQRPLESSPPPQQGGGHPGGRGWGPQGRSGGHGGYGGGRGGGMPQQPQPYGGPPEYQGRGRGGPPQHGVRGGYSGGRSMGGSRGGGTPGGPSGYSVPELHQATQAPYQAGATPQQMEPSSSSSSQPPEPSEIAESIRQLSIQQEGAPQRAPPSSKSITFHPRPGKGSSGTKCLVKANHFFAELPDKALHHYDVTITPEVSSRVVNRQVMNKLVESYRESHLGKRLPAYDGRKSLYTAGPLPFNPNEFRITLIEDDGGTGGPRREREFKVVIKLVARPNLYHLGSFLQGRQADAPQEALQVLDIVLRELPTSRYCPVGRSFYSPDLGRRQPLGEGLESWRGFYQSFRPTQMGLSLNIDMSSTAFIEPLPVIDFVTQLLNRDVVFRPLSDADRVKIKKALKGVKVEVTHRGNMRRKYRISGLTPQATRELTFPVDDRGTMKSVVGYFQEIHHFEIKHALWPCLQVGNQNRPNYLPMEVCKIVEGQRYSKRLNERQITALLKVTCQRPQERELDITRVRNLKKHVKKVVAGLVK